MWSKRCTYALRATLYLAAQQQDGYVPIRQISDQLDIPYAYLTKVLQELIRRGLLQSLRGPHGGVALAQPAHTIALRDIIEVIDGAGLFTECVLGLPKCDAAAPCSLHNQWKPIRHSIGTMLSQTALDDIADQLAIWERKQQDSEEGVSDAPFFESI
ncbi:MAG TPA: Rrf2 family transcriptional regulator [Rhodothermales bacterium]|nr:Rrf2 family transcriptional regulator [Rhodothermales bacterium]